LKVFPTAVAALTLLLAPQPPAASKELPRGPVAVMRPDGHVFVVAGSPAKRFVRDANSIQCGDSCDSPDAAAKVAGGPVSGATEERYLVAFKGWGGGADFNWTAAAWFYPSTAEEPAYLVWPMAIGDERGAWAEWQEATPRMERIVLGSRASEAPLPFTGQESLPDIFSAIALTLIALGSVLVHSSRRRRSVLPAVASSKRTRTPD